MTCCPTCGGGGVVVKPKERKALDAIVDTVLKYRPKARSKPAVQRKRRKTLLEKKRGNEV
jgi:transposase